MTDLSQHHRQGPRPTREQCLNESAQIAAEMWLDLTPEEQQMYADQVREEELRRAS